MAVLTSAYGGDVCVPEQVVSSVREWIGSVLERGEASEQLGIFWELDAVLTLDAMEISTWMTDAGAALSPNNTMSGYVGAPRVMAEGRHSSNSLRNLPCGCSCGGIAVNGQPEPV